MSDLFLLGSFEGCIAYIDELLSLASLIILHVSPISQNNKYRYFTVMVFCKNYIQRDSWQYHDDKHFKPKQNKCA